jgi:hypothetical protein
LVKEFAAIKSRRKQRFIRMPLKGETMASCYPKEHRMLRHG